VRGIWRRSEAQGVNVLRCQTKVRKLFIIKRTEPRPDALLPGIVVSLNKSAHQARLGFQVPGRACGHASPQKLKVHHRLLLFLQRETEARTRAGGQMSWACGTLCRHPSPVWSRTVPAPARSGACPVADVPSSWRKTPYVVQGARARLRDLALQLSILRRIPSRQAATGCPFLGREYGGWATRLG
jgi:hypothetical protein